MKKIIFLADGHSYWLLDDSQKGIKNKIKATRISSVGSVFGPCFPKFEDVSDYWLTNGTFKALLGEQFVKDKRKEYGKIHMPDPNLIFPDMLNHVVPEDFFRVRKQLKDEWDYNGAISRWRGTKFHKEREESAKKDGFIINPFTGKKFDLITVEKEYDNEAICENLFDLEPGVYTELLVFDMELMICGQIDECFIEKKGKKKLISINDHKTNDEMPSKSDREYGFYPFNELQASDYTKYGCQLSLYAFILERAGFTIQNIGFTHYLQYDIQKKTLVEIDYFNTFKDKIEKLF